MDTSFPRFCSRGACAEGMTPALMDCIAFLRWASLCRLQFHYGFVGKLVYLLITYTGGLRSSDPELAARVTQVSLYGRKRRMLCLREGGPHMLNVKSNYRTSKRCAQLCQVFIFSWRVAAEAYACWGGCIPPVVLVLRSFNLYMLTDFQAFQFSNWKRGKFANVIKTHTSNRCSRLCFNKNCRGWDDFKAQSYMTCFVLGNMQCQCIALGRKQNPVVLDKMRSRGS